MPVLLGLILLPIVGLIIEKIGLIKTKKIEKIILNALLILIPIIYIIFCLAINMEPFDFRDYYSIEYMRFRRPFIT